MGPAAAKPAGSELHNKDKEIALYTTDLRGLWRERNAMVTENACLIRESYMFGCVCNVCKYVHMRIYFPLME